MNEDMHTNANFCWAKKCHKLHRNRTDFCLNGQAGWAQPWKSELSRRTDQHLKQVVWPSGLRRWFESHHCHFSIKTCEAHFLQGPQRRVAVSLLTASVSKME